MRTLAGLFLASALAAAPHIGKGRVVNAASNIPPGLPPYGVAQGAIFSIFGDALSGDPQQADYPLPVSLGGTSVQVTVGDATVDAILLSVSPQQIKAILPSKTPLGDGAVTVTFNGERSAAEPILVVASGFGIFTQDKNGSGPAKALNVYVNEQLLNGRLESAQPGQTIALQGTGLGAVDFDETGPPSAGDLDIAVEVYVGGKLARVLYKGRSSCCAGFDEIDFVVPAGVQGCNVPVVVRSGGVTGNYATISINSDSKLCSDPNDFSSQGAQGIGADQPIRLGSINLARAITKFDSQELKTDAAGASFNQFETFQLLESQRSVQPPGSCLVATSQVNVSFPSGPSAKVLDAGPQINIVGPNGSKRLTKDGGIYSTGLGGFLPAPPANAPEFLVAGDYTADNGAGGADIGPFRTTLTIATPVTWTNADALVNVDRTQDLTLTWTGGGANDFVSVTGSSITGLAQAAFICVERATAGQFTVPSFVMQSLPVSDVRNGDTQGGLSVSSIGGSPFTVAGLDLAYFTSSSARFKAVAFK